MASNTSLLFATVTLLLDSCNALYELKSCTNEIVLFFLNGETKLGSDCCNAVEVITTDCWPAMLTSLGFTPEETNVLRGNCQPLNSGGSSSPAPSSPVKL
ncbi:hypothetical protein EUTSA_v10000570mg [Eutrema salsugineum]|uniref:Prolamin-like domain-containing protein n=1 Tax=Eutrema salsugineum TaxID=72664 RepID=V4NIL8_EUTSA|nr:hypothetical protein EUTSA_v10000570mg [Eutrema salsugineum]